MKEITSIAPQGDVCFIKVDKMPEGTKLEDNLVVAHSETGHHHVASGDVNMFSSGNPLVNYLVAKGDVDITHYRDEHTHEPMKLLYDDSADNGETIWEVRKQKEWTPEGWQRALD